MELSPTSPLLFTLLFFSPFTAFTRLSPPLLASLGSPISGFISGKENSACSKALPIAEFMNPQRQDSSLEPRTHRCLRGSGQRPIKTLYLEPCSLWHFHQHTLASQQLSSLGMISPKFFMCLPAVLFPLGIQSTSLPNFIDGPHSAFLPEATQEFSWESSSPFLIVCDSSVPLHVPHQWKLLFSEDTENLNGQYSFPSQASHLLPPPFESDFQNEVFFYFLWNTPFIHISIHLYVIKKNIL